MSKLHRAFATNRSQNRSAGSDAFKLLPLVTLSGPGEGLPQVLCGPLLADDTRGEPEMRIDVRVGAIRCFSAPQSRSASLLDSRAPQAQDVVITTRRHMIVINYTAGRVGSIDVPLGLARQSVRKAKLVSPIGR